MSNDENNYDLIVIGAGMAGNAAANKCASAGWRVAIVDELPYGGTCALRGCDPKKILRRGAEIIDSARLMSGKGIDVDGLHINWADLMKPKLGFTSSTRSTPAPPATSSRTHPPSRSSRRSARSAGAEPALAPHVANRLMSDLRKAEPDALTAREIDVLELAADGHGNREIARQLHIGEATVKSHLVHIYRKLGVDDRTHAVTIAVQRGVIRLGAPGSPRCR